MEKGHTISILDHGYVKYINHMGCDEDIIETARMSTNKGFLNWDSDMELLEYLYEMRHTSPFESGELVVEVQAPIMVFREWHRHRTQSYNEMSARYTKMPDIHYVPTFDRIKKQSKTNKQSSSSSDLDTEIKDNFINEIRLEQKTVYAEYEKFLYQGVAREVARINTPVSRYSRMRAKANLKNWLGFLDLRMRDNAQWEIRQYANAVAGIIKELWPRTYKLYEEYTLYAVSFSKSEKEILKKAIEFSKDYRLSNSVGALFTEDEEKMLKKIEKKLNK